MGQTRCGSNPSFLFYRTNQVHRNRDKREFHHCSHCSDISSSSSSVMWGSRWSSTPDRSPNSQRSRSSPPESHSPTQPDMLPLYRPPPPLPPCNSNSRLKSHSKQPRPRHTVDTPPEPNTWTVPHRTDRPGHSERNSL